MALFQNISLPSLTPSKFIGLEVQWHGADQKVFAVVLELKGGVISKLEEIEGPDFTCLEALDKGVPVALSISGRGVIGKEVSAKAISEGRAVELVLPNAKSDDFYLQLEGTFATISRKDHVQKIVEELSGLGFSVCDVSLGGIPLQSLNGILGNPELIQAGPHQLQTHEGKLSSYLFKPNDSSTIFMIGEEKIKPELALAYTLAFQQLAPIASIVITDGPWETNREELKQQKLFKLTGWGILMLFLVALMTNYFVFSHFEQKKNELSSQLGMYQGLLDRSDSLKKEVEEKQHFLEGAGWTKPSRTSYYADQIALTVPKSVLLKELNLHTLDKKASREQRKNIFLADRLQLQGECSKVTELNPWIETLKGMDWITDVEVNYAYDQKERVGNFIIDIQL